MTKPTNSEMILYLRILDQFPNPIWRAGLDGKCDYFNPAWLKFTGRTIDQEMGDGWAEGVHPQDLERCLSIYTKHFKAQKPFSMEYRLKHNDDTYHWISDHGSPFFDDNKNFLGYIGSCYDIQSIKEHIQEIEKLNQLMIDRELKMTEMKEKIKSLEKNLKQQEST